MTYTTEPTVEFSGYIATERARLTERKQALLDTQRQVAHDLTAIDAEFVAIQAYEKAKTGAKSKSNGSRPARQSNRGKRGEVLELVTVNSGLGRAQIIDALGARGDKSAEMSISNALTALVKTEQLTRENGKYFAQAA